MKRHILVFPIAALAASTAFGQSLSELQRDFITPQPQHKPTIIWQWMDGLVTKDGVTRDLEAFKEAGLAGVQNFQIGGPQQSQVGNPDMPIGGDRWKDMLRYTLDECERLGLTFGTHNCPGWTSSAHRWWRDASRLAPLRKRAADGHIALYRTVWFTFCYCHERAGQQAVARASGCGGQHDCEWDVENLFPTT